MSSLVILAASVSELSPGKTNRQKALKILATRPTSTEVKTTVKTVFLPVVVAVTMNQEVDRAA